MLPSLNLFVLGSKKEQGADTVSELTVSLLMSSLNPYLQQRIAEFLPTIRVGIDIGESAGGIAVVKDNTVLHTETYLDFHETDLKERRDLRRGRRTRHSKKLRLARLRSWVLRHKLPDGTRLPDPYEILKDKQFWVQPGVFQKKGIEPLQQSSWIEKAKTPETNPTIFVRALTLLFKKRGYKYDQRGIAELTDAELKEFLASARIPKEIGELYDQIKNEITRREQNPDLPIRGKKKVTASELFESLEKATTRPRQPRIAEPRQIKQEELRAIVESFCDKYHIQQKEQWKKELIGLLNKFVRLARFENRLRSGCSWCGKPTPRKEKVREIAYKAAVNNLRVREGRNIRPLNETEQQKFWDWWKERNQPTDEDKRKAGKRTIENYLRKINAQSKMVNQIFDLLTNSDPKGRANLCMNCLKLAAAGKTMQEAGLEWKTVVARKTPNPKREQHDLRVMHRLESIL
ncbi:MAG: RRXRR domain-containing protein, partial [bacterium]|nr:RRXRR domain-containing protein [bacterium]